MSVRCKLGEVLSLEAENMNESKSKHDGGLVELSLEGIALSLAGIALSSASIALDLVYVSIV